MPLPPPLLRRLPVLLLMGAVFVQFGCDNVDAQRDFEDEAFDVPNGFTETDENGEVIRQDPDDWRIAPAFTGLIRISPAFPNPTQNSFVTIPLTITQFDRLQGGLVLRGLDGAGRFVTLQIIENTGSPGAYVFSFSAAFLNGEGLQRLYIFDATNRVVSYGDLMVQGPDQLPE